MLARRAGHVPGDPDAQPRRDRVRLVLVHVPPARRCRPAAAALGGLFCGFAPQMVSHANAHLNWTAQWLVPLLLWRVLRGCASPGTRRAQRRDPRRARRGRVLDRRRGAVLHRPGVRGVPRRLGARPGAPAGRARGAAGVCCAGSRSPPRTAGVLLAYPLWLHFFGPQRYHGTGFSHARAQRGPRRVRGVPGPLARRRRGPRHRAGAQPDRGELVLRRPAAAARRRLLRDAAAAAPRRPVGPTLWRGRRSPRSCSPCCRSGPAVKLLRRASPTSRCRTPCWARCPSSTRRCRRGWPWSSRR